MADDNIHHTVVIDSGSGFIKAGFGGDSIPKYVFPSLIGRSADKEVFVGEEALERRDSLTLSMPIKQGIITNWDDMEELWHYTFYNKLKIAPEDYNVLLTEPPLNPKANREKMAQSMLETFNVTGFYIATQACLALIANGRTSGTVLDSGDGVTHSTALFDSFIIPHATLRLDVAGRDLTDYMKQLLIEKGVSFNGLGQRRIVEDIKEQLCYVALNFDNEVKVGENVGVPYQLPNGEIIHIGRERFKCPELLFKPSLVGDDGLGCHDIIFSTIQKCDISIRQDLFSSILVCGGSTMFTGFADRLRHEVIAVAEDGYTINVFDPPGRLHFPWVGGRYLAKETQSLWITKEEYNSAGPSIVDERCVL